MKQCPRQINHPLLIYEERHRARCPALPEKAALVLLGHAVGGAHPAGGLCHLIAGQRHTVFLGRKGTADMGFMFSAAKFEADSPEIGTGDMANRKLMH